MNLTPLLVVLLGVVTACGCYSTVLYEFPKVISDDEPLKMNIDRGNRYDGSQVVLTARGLVPPVFLPRGLNDSINLAIIPVYAEFLSRKGIKAVEILGTEGEGPTLSMEERKKVIDAWVAVGKKFDMHIMVQVGGVPYADIIATAHYAQAAGADSILTLPEVYYKPASIQQLMQFVEEVAGAAPNLPVLYYHYPNMTGVDFPPQDIVAYLNPRVLNFRGIKYETSDLSQLSATLSEISYGQNLFFSADRLIAPGALLGVRSAISGTLNFWPQLVREIIGAVKQSDTKRAQELQKKIIMGYDAILAAGNRVSALKAAMEIVTEIKVGPPGRPLPMITPAARARLELELRALDLVSKSL